MAKSTLCSIDARIVPRRVRQREGSARYFTCPYHGWTFSNAGKCVSIPGADAYESDSKLDAYNLSKIPRLETYRGFIFGTLNREAPELVEHLARRACFWTSGWIVTPVLS